MEQISDYGDGWSSSHAVQVRDNNSQTGRWLQRGRRTDRQKKIKNYVGLLCDCFCFMVQLCYLSHLRFTSRIWSVLPTVFSSLSNIRPWGGLTATSYQFSITSCPVKSLGGTVRQGKKKYWSSYHNLKELLISFPNFIPLVYFLKDKIFSFRDVIFTFSKLFIPFVHFKQ